MREGFCGNAATMLVMFMAWERIRFCKVGVLFCGGLLRGLGKIGFGNKNKKSYWVLHLSQSPCHPVCKFTRKKVEITICQTK